MQRSIQRLAPHGSTNVQAGLNQGVRLADRIRRERPEAYNYVILMSDGVANVDATNPFAILESAYDRNALNPLRLITIGVGINNYNDVLLEQLAQHGNGWYRYLDNTGQAQATFSRDNWLALSTPFADQTRAQVTWDPDLVRSWRIIGYENRVTSDQSFAEDRKEFAEIPSGAATTVFYEVELHDRARARAGQEVTLANVELRWVVAETGQSRSQRAEVRGRLGTSLNATGDPLFQLGAIVALSADRYGGLFDGEYVAEISRDLTELEDRLRFAEQPAWVALAPTRTSGSCWSTWRSGHARKRRRPHRRAIAASRTAHATGRPRLGRGRPVGVFKVRSERSGRIPEGRRASRGRVRRPGADGWRDGCGPGCRRGHKWRPSLGGAVRGRCVPHRRDRR